MSGSLSARTVLVPESRELDLFAGMLEAEGAVARRCPLLTILDLADPAPLDAWLALLTRDGLDDLVLMTGEGLRRILSRAEILDIGPAATAAIGRLRTIVRGPKPVRALRMVGLIAGLSAAEPTSTGLIRTLSALDLNGRRIGLQNHPGQSSMLADHLSGMGALVHAVTPYRYASQSDDAAVAAAIQALADGEIDWIAFTSSPQIDRLFQVAREHGLEQRLRKGLAQARIASIGPIVTERLKAMDLTPAVAPGAFHLKPLIKAMARAD